MIVNGLDGVATVLPNCVVVAKAGLVPVNHTFAFFISALDVVPLILKVKELATNGERLSIVVIAIWII